MLVVALGPYYANAKNSYSVVFSKMFFSSPAFLCAAFPQTKPNSPFRVPRDCCLRFPPNYAFLPPSPSSQRSIAIPPNNFPRGCLPWSTRARAPTELEKGGGGRSRWRVKSETEKGTPLLRRPTHRPAQRQARSAFNGHSWARTPRILRAREGGLLHKVRTLLQWNPEAGGGHNPDPLRAQVCFNPRCMNYGFIKFTLHVFEELGQKILQI